MRRFLPLILALFSIFDAFAQNSDNKLNLNEGTRYMVAFPQVWASPSEKPLPQPMMIFISSKVKTKVKIHTPSKINENPIIDREFTLEPNEVLKYPIPLSYMNTESQTKKGYGILVTSNDPISVSTYQAWMGNGELARHLPMDSWGKEYYSMNFYQDRYGTNGDYKYRPSQILIIAGRDNTVVSYTPVWKTEGGNDNPSVWKDQTQTIVLNKGETYLIKGDINTGLNKEWETDLSGTHIRSSRPIGVISGHTKVGILRYPDVLPPTGMFATEAHFVRNNVHDAILPVEMSGTEFVTIPSRYTSLRVSVGETGAQLGIENDKGDVIRFIALEDNTKIYRLRSDGSDFAPERTLRKGESYIVPGLEETTLWKSDKAVIACQYGKSYAKVIPPSISKDGDNIQGHPTVESGMPMMEYVPPIDRWVNYGVFYSPEDMDNFVNIVFKTEDVNKIKFDGKPIMSAFGGAMRPIRGTPYSYISASVGSGDHVIESTDPKSVWCAWNYGSLDGLQQGRAYGTPVAVDVAVACDDSLEIDYVVSCGNSVVDGNVKLLPENSVCAQFYAFVIENDSNYIIDVNRDDVSEVSTLPFKLTVINKRKSAYAKIIVITRSGNWIEKEFSYDGIDVSFNPTEINFGTQPVNQEVCREVVVTNNGKSSITISNLRFSKPEFVVQPSSIEVGPGQSVNLKICGKLLSPIEVSDQLLCEINCTDIEVLPVVMKSEEPVFYASDQDWGIIPSNDKQTRKVELVNAGKAEVVITDYSPKGNAYFTNSTLVNSLPLTLKSGERFSYNVDYSPNGEEGIQHTLRIEYVVNAKREKLYSDLRGMGSDAELSVSSFGWEERVIDGYQTKNGITEYTGKIEIKNLGNTTAYIKSIEIPETAFTFTANSTILDGMSPSETKTIDVFFAPNELPSRGAESQYMAAVIVTYEVNGVEKQTIGRLDGTALQPQIHLTDQDWGTRQSNSRTTLPVYVENKNYYAKAPLNNDNVGTMDLIIDSIVIEDEQPFVWTNTNTKIIRFSPSLVVSQSDPIVKLDVDFIPTQPGSFKATYFVYGNVLDTNFATLQGNVPGENKIEPLYLISWYSVPTTGSISGVITYDTKLRFKEFRGGNYSQFDVSPNQSIADFDVSANVPFIFDVEFTPSWVSKNGLKIGQNLDGRLPYRDESFATEIVFEDLTTGKEVVGQITGDGKYLETTLRIVAPKDIAVGDESTVSFFLEPTPESIDSGDVKSARLRVIYDPAVIYPLSIKNFPTSTLIEETGSIGMVELDLITPPQRDGFLGSYNFGTLFDANSSSDIDGLYYTIDKENVLGSPYVVINVIPDEITIKEVCGEGLRLVDFRDSYRVQIKNNVIEVSVGLDAPLTIHSVNELGQQELIFSEYVSSGTYRFVTHRKGLQWIVVRQGDWVETIGVFID